jgi:hypothetical protein
MGIFSHFALLGFTLISRASSLFEAFCPRHLTCSGQIGESKGETSMSGQGVKLNNLPPFQAGT